jgi:hypothetical protein
MDSGVPSTSSGGMTRMHHDTAVRICALLASSSIS